jgi:hypothetical protein
VEARHLLTVTDPETAAYFLGNGREVAAHDTVPFAIWAAARHLTDYEQAIWATATAGGDIDTTCAIVGGITATASPGSLPRTWLQAAEPLPRGSARHPAHRPRLSFCRRRGDDGCVEPNLARIPADKDADAKAILDLACDGVTADLLGCMTDSDAMALGRYGARIVTVALRRRSAALLREALLATAIAQAVHASDDRDVMVGLATDHFAAGQLGLVPAELFGDVASCLPDGWVPDLLREFGARTDITLEAFGWLLVETPDGPDFVPAPPPWAREHRRDEGQ